MAGNHGTNYAAIDIGSNAARLLIKRVSEKADGTPEFTKMIMVRVPLRLGFDVFTIGKLTEKRERNMMKLMKSYHQLMEIYDVESYRACATSAMRDAKNGKKIIKRIKEKTGIDIEIIEGKEEAKIVYNNHVECMEDRNGNYMYVDVGGGSTEVNLLSQGELKYSHSYNIGTVRILNNVVKDGEWDQLKADMRELSLRYPGTNIIGSGGNINKLYRLAEKKDRKRLRITVETLRELYDQLAALTVEQRMEEFKLKPDRADVIVPAGLIFLTISDIIHADYIYVPVIGLSDGIIDSLYTANKVWE